MFNPNQESVRIQKWGGLASFVLAATFIASSLIYLTGNLREANGPVVYSIADFLYGPVWAASLITAVLALRERVGESAPRRMNLALLAAFAAAFAFVAVACIRSANRHYHLIHPELHLESSTSILVVWTTLVAGMIGTAFHFLGWTLLLIGTAGWSSGRISRGLCALYLLAGITSLFVYLLPELEGNAIALVVLVSIWQGIVLLRAKSGEVKVPKLEKSQPDQA